MDQDILAPLQYNGTMNHELFETWFKEQLLQVVPRGTVIVMDNASFHRKETLHNLAESHDCFVMFLPPYSPDLNPIEHFGAWLKSTLRNICVHLTREPKCGMIKDMEKLQEIYDIMPAGWKEAAKEKKALVRSRNIQTAEELLRLNLLYQTNGESYGLTSVLTQISENQKGLNKTAVQKRIINSTQWLKWLCEHLCRQENFLTQPPEWLTPYRVCLVDASDYAKQGSKGADFRFHCMTELFTLNLSEFHFTTASEGETLTRYANIQKDDLILADRGYASIKSISHVLTHQAQYLIRLRARAFNLYQNVGDREAFDLTEQLRTAWAPGKVLEFHLYFRLGKDYVPLRICALGKTPEQFERSQRQSVRTNHGKKKASPLQSIWNLHTIVMTSLPESITARQVLELYRMRWQIELVFKRFKSVFGGRSFTARKEESVRAWFYGKLLLSIICEALMKKGHFSPSNEEGTV